VRHLLEGGVRREGDNVRITTRLFGSHISAVQDDVTQNIVRSLVAHVDRSELARISRKATTSLAAYDLYLRARRSSPCATATRGARWKPIPG
jgi:hypothetical protein